MLFYIATHRAILFNLFPLNWIRHRKTATIATSKTITPAVMPMVISIELVVSIIKKTL